ncbi:replicative DNA helicase [Nesterenkonia haasae]|uniref:replicative DNA helicase n=1 Tax=Nesterenkonia haasae TaxID=2587813 RepID=UPI001390CD81|nr:replicative DNA helicase [Nesterenkonia haasae]NDK31195.1 hypothetical protein [Nesterenkonia haasae]
MEVTQQTAPEAERALLGAVLYSGGRALDHLDFDPADYAEPRWEMIHTIVRDLRKAGQVVDPITVDEQVRKHNGGKPVTADLHRLMELPVSPASAEHYAAIVTTWATRRRLMETSDKIRSLTVDGLDPDAVLAEAHNMLEGVRARSTTTEQVRFIGETLADTIEGLNHKASFTPTPWPALDHLIGGFRPGALYVTGARTGVGKSLFALESALSLAGQGSVAFISPEMPESEVHHRMIANRGGVGIKNLIDRDISERDWERIKAANDQLVDAPIAIREGAATVAQVRRFVASVHARKPLAGVIVDYIQMIRPPDGDRRDKREQVAEVSWAMKDLAMKYKIPVIALAQLSRGAVAEDKPPQIHHLKESGSIEEDSDVVLMLHRPPSQDWEMSVIVGKNRHGPVGDFALEFRGYNSTLGGHNQRRKP